MTTSGGRRAEADDEYTGYVRSRMVKWRRTAYLMSLLPAGGTRALFPAVTLVPEPANWRTHLDR
ncbi:hypothetical protein [Micromonospora sp. DH14]|uniref:hypothetical protein n=1 Tax=Micromonospora sp. DH14 TaxID=3040120 RepID=UPI0024424773|nr:hypothetical protein [Micromonospora sp. DH14]MDG9672881.1 hypothetical protein [Micromonospora sp. DH14]